jgi:hypothetical protein
MTAPAVIKTTPEGLRAIEAAFVMAVADASRDAILQAAGLLPPPPASVIERLAEREQEATARA